MAKKRGTRKKSTKKKPSSRKTTKKSGSDKNIEKILVQNFVELQKVMTILSIKFDKLGSQISNLLEIFEKSAEALSKKDLKAQQETNETNEILKSVKDLADQNKTIAKALSLMNSGVPEIAPKQMPPPQRIDSSFPRTNSPQKDYQASINSRIQKLRRPEGE
jgi:seryl-tRNA synthetase